MLEQLTLNVANVTTLDPDPDSVPPGDYVAVTVRGRVAWEAEATWQPTRPGSVS